MGLFGPAWKTTNPKKAYKGILYVEKVTDDKELYEIATNAQLEDVAVAAVKRISSEPLLAKIASKGNTMIRGRSGKEDPIPGKRAVQEAALACIQDYEVLIRLIRAGKGGSRIAIAEDPATPADVLAELAVDTPEEVRTKVAANPSTPVETLVGLAEDESARVCCRVAANPSTPHTSLVDLCTHDDQFVRAEVADNPSSPASALRSLSRDSQPIIRMKVAQNPSVPPNVLVALCHDDDENVREVVVSHVKSIPPDVLAEMASYETYSLCCAIARHPSTPIEALELLARNDAERVRTLANEALCARLGHDLDKHCICKRCGTKVDHVFTRMDGLEEGDVCARCGGRIVKTEWHTHFFDDTSYRQGILRFPDGSEERLNDWDDVIHREQVSA